MSNAATGIDQTEAKIKEYLTSNTMAEFGSDVNEETDLFKEGIIDSFGYIELVKFLEKEFKVKFSDEELVSNQLNTVKNITNIVQGKVNAR